MIPAELADTVHAPPGFLLVERLEMPVKRGKLWLPDNWRLTTRSSEAVVVSSGEGVYDYHPGEKVFLSSSVGRSIEFGIGSEARTLWKVFPRQILARVKESDEERLVNRGTHHLYRAVEVDPSDLDQVVDEGDLRGIR